MLSVWLRDTTLWSLFNAWKTVMSRCRSEIRDRSRRKYTVGHKKETTYFCLYVRQTSTDFNTVSPLDLQNEWYMRRCTLHSPHLISVTTLPCENRNVENVHYSGILTKQIASNASQHHCNGPWESPYALNLFIWGVMQQCVYETTIHDIDDLWCKHGLTLNRTLLTLRFTSGATVWDHMCVGGGHFEHLF